MDARLRAAAEAAPGFLPADEGLALYRAAYHAARYGPLLEIGTYCGKSTLYLAAAAREHGQCVITVDHHRGSEEHQPGWEYHDPALVDPATGRLDTLPILRRTLHHAGVEESVVVLVASSALAARIWRAPLALVFIDGSHTEPAAFADYHGWTPHLRPDGVLAIHDVFPDPANGGQAPYRVFQTALRSGHFTQTSVTGSLRLLRRTSATPGNRPDHS